MDTFLIFLALIILSLGLGRISDAINHQTTVLHRDYCIVHQDIIDCKIDDIKLKTNTP